MTPLPVNSRQKLLVSLLDGSDSCPPFRAGAKVVLYPPKGISYLDHANNLLAAAGLTNTEELRSLPGLPAERWIIRVLPNPPTEFRSSFEPLLCAAVLGLAGPTFYSSERPFVWTAKRLSRVITLHQVDHFYEN